MDESGNESDGAGSLGGRIVNPQLTYGSVKAATTLQASSNLAAERLERQSFFLGLIRVALFVAMVVTLSYAISNNTLSYWCVFGVTLSSFLITVRYHAGVIKKKKRAQTEVRVATRFLHRENGTFAQTSKKRANTDEDEFVEHIYAHDLDIVGTRSLVERISVAHTTRGAATLRAWLLEASPPSVTQRRQVAVAELGGNHELRFAVETDALIAGEDKLDPQALESFGTGHVVNIGLPLALVAVVLPLATVALGFATLELQSSVSRAAFVACAIAQLVVATLGSGRTKESFLLVAARAGYVEAFMSMLDRVAEAEVDAEALKEIRSKIRINDVRPRRYLGRLKTIASFAELHLQALAHFLINLFFLYDVHVGYALRRWQKDFGRELKTVFDALAEFEALSSLATLYSSDAEASLPILEGADRVFGARDIGHPLMHRDARTTNDVRLASADGAVVITGSNMAGKSTLLRAVGQNIALALAGGPVIASAMRVPYVRLRTSMRIHDSLAEGASYFKAELTRIRAVSEKLDAKPPVFFLLDELLRGTNEKARRIGARSIVVHLLGHGARGLIATHDLSLTELEQRFAGRVSNHHFTDAMRDGEMIFDYKLQKGVVARSNALELITMAGIPLDNI